MRALTEKVKKLGKRDAENEISVRPTTPSTGRLRPRADFNLKDMVDSIDPDDEYMRFDLTRLARATNVAAVGILVAIGAFLVTSPLHPGVEDSHSGLMAVFPGVMLLIFALLIHATGRWLSRRGYVGSLIAILVSVTAIVTLVALQLG